jgi:hypothetical protein
MKLGAKANDNDYYHKDLAPGIATPGARRGAKKLLRKARRQETKADIEREVANG